MAHRCFAPAPLVAALGSPPSLPPARRRPPPSPGRAAWREKDLPFTLSPEYQAAQRAYMRYHNMNPIYGISSR